MTLCLCYTKATKINTEYFMYKRIIRSFYILLITLALLVTFSACGSSGTDSPTDQGSELDTSLYLPITEDGEAAVTVVSSYSKSTDYAAAFNRLLSHFSEAGIKFKFAYEASDDKTKPELIIGEGVQASGEFFIDPHSLGDEGYAIRVVGNKTVVAGGSTESLIKAIAILEKEILKLDKEDTDLSNLAIPRSTDVYVRQYYPIKSITVSGNDLSGYDIVCNTADQDEKYCADALHNILYDNAGYWLNVRRSSARPSIRISVTDDAGDGFRVYTSGDDLIIECSYPVLLKESVDKFINDLFSSRKERELHLDGGVYSLSISTVSYSDFGAVGDGVTDDYEAIKAAHIEANRTGQTVVAAKGATYYLGQHTEPIVIKTNTVWTGAGFIIDDSGILPEDEARNVNVFSVESDLFAMPLVGFEPLSKGQTNIGMTFDGPTLIYLVYRGHKQYIRYGANQDAGADQQEIILVDKDGNVDPSTPILWDYPVVSSAVAYPVYDKPILITGGSFVTVANSAPREYTYYARGIVIKRSNVTVDNLTHTVVGEGDSGAPYVGFINITRCNNVLVENTVLTGHKVYKLITDANNSMGTYDISITLANNVTFRKCKQTNSITDTSYWGIMGSNYSKNLTYDGCVFSRFDAHKGTHNATIINSEIGHQRLNIIGSGLLTVENTVVHANTLINLRNDYGSTWEGDIILRNVTLNNTSNNPTLINANWYNHYFGYTCYLPENIIIDGITIAKGNTFYVLPALRNGIDKDTVDEAENKNKIVLTKNITVVSNPSNYVFYVSKNSVLFENVELTVSQ